MPDPRIKCGAGKSGMTNVKKKGFLCEYSESPGSYQYQNLRHVLHSLQGSSLPIIQTALPSRFVLLLSYDATHNCLECNSGAEFDISDGERSEDCRLTFGYGAAIK
jgi:hypothetical protein